MDHIEPSQGRIEVFERTYNHISLCHSCHNTITSKFDRDYRPGGDSTPKLRWIAETRESNQVRRDRKFQPVKALRYKE